MLADFKLANRSTPFWCTVSLLVACGCIAVGFYLHLETGTKLSFLYRDANAIAGQPFFYGILEVATGSMLLMSGATLLFEALTEAFEDRGVMRFLLIFGLLTVALGFDDLLMLHESAGFFHWRIEEKHVYALYGVVLLLAIGLYFKVFLRTPFLILAISLAFLAASAAEDELGIRPFGVGLEDYLEIFAFAFWASYSISIAIAAKRNLFSSRKELLVRTQQDFSRAGASTSDLHTLHRDS